jgi:hypothetical protein
MAGTRFFAPYQVQTEKNITIHPQICLDARCTLPFKLHPEATIGKEGEGPEISFLHTPPREKPRSHNKRAMLRMVQLTIILRN